MGCTDIMELCGTNRGQIELFFKSNFRKIGFNHFEDECLQSSSWKNAQIHCQLLFFGSQCLKITQNVLTLVKLKLTCLVILFRFSKTCQTQNWPFLAFLLNFCPLKMLAMLNETFSLIFKHCGLLRWLAKISKIRASS